MNTYPLPPLPPRPEQQYPIAPMQQYKIAPLQQYQMMPMQQYPGAPMQQYPMLPTQQYQVVPMQQYHMAPIQQHNAMHMQQQVMLPMQSYPVAPTQHYSFQDNSSAPALYSIPFSQRIVLITMPVKALKTLGIKKPVDIVAHWAICINGMCYELARQQNNKKEPYFYRATPEQEFRRRRGANIEDAYLGDMAMRYTHSIIDEVAQLIWERSLKKKYAFDENNCQVFIRLLIELIGDQNAKAEFPAFLDRWVKGAGNTRDGGIFAFAAGASVLAASLSTLAVDPTGTTAAGFAIAAQTTLRSTAWLLTDRDNRGKKIQEGQREIREVMRQRGKPLAEPPEVKKKKK